MGQILILTSGLAISTPCFLTKLYEHSSWMLWILFLFQPFATCSSPGFGPHWWVLLTRVFLLSPFVSQSSRAGPWCSSGLLFCIFFFFFFLLGDVPCTSSGGSPALGDILQITRLSSKWPEGSSLNRHIVTMKSQNANVDRDIDLLVQDLSNYMLESSGSPTWKSLVDFSGQR